MALALMNILIVGSLRMMRPTMLTAMRMWIGTITSLTRSSMVAALSCMSKMIGRAVLSRARLMATMTSALAMMLLQL